MLDKIEYAAGEIASIRALLFALMNTHPDPHRLKAEFDRLKLIQDAHSIPARVSDDYLEGQASTGGDFETYLDALTANNKPL